MPTQILSEYFSEPSTQDHFGGAESLQVAESNHRIANNLNLIAGMLRLQVNEITKAERPLDIHDAKMLLAEVSTRIETVARLHRLLAQGGASCLSLTEYLQDIAQAAIQSMSGKNIVLAAPPSTSCRLPAQIALSVGFMVGEAVTNAVKYAHPAGAPGVIALDCQRTADGSTIVRIHDDGVGLPQDFDANNDGGLGVNPFRSHWAVINTPTSESLDHLAVTANAKPEAMRTT
jgi:two-component sensor histidine kinase